LSENFICRIPDLYGLVSLAELVLMWALFFVVFETAAFELCKNRGNNLKQLENLFSFPNIVTLNLRNNHLKDSKEISGRLSFVQNWKTLPSKGTRVSMNGLLRNSKIQFPKIALPLKDHSKKTRDRVNQVHQKNIPLRDTAGKRKKWRLKI
jgi:hypothetical protein